MIGWGEGRALSPERRRRLITLILGVLMVGVAIASVGMGRIDVPPTRVVAILASPWWPPAVPVTRLEWSVVVIVRCPRVALAVLSGAGLALCGAALQGVFRNPLVGPQVVGVTAGAAFGGVLALLAGLGHGGLLGLAFVFGLAALGLVRLIAVFAGGRDILILVLAGVVVTGFFQALVGLVQYLADSEDTLPAMVFWLLGSFATADYAKVWVVGPPVVVAGGLLVALRWRINVLSMGDEDARALGQPVAPLRWAVLGLSAVIVAAQVSVSGQIGWVGLVVPHLARRLVGPDHRALMPASLFLGGLFMVVVDDVARTLGTGEIPLGILTALVGTPVFAVLLCRARRAGGYGG